VLVGWVAFSLPLFGGKFSIIIIIIIIIMPQDRRTERNKKYEGQHSGENKRKMAREEDAWTFAT
jgi:hypothetical protein